MEAKRKYDEYAHPSESNDSRINSTRTNVYTLYSIVPSKDQEYSATYKQVAKYYSESHICYKVNELIKKKYDAKKENYRYQLSYFEEGEEENSFRRTQLRRFIEGTYVPLNITRILELYKNNDALFYSNERLYDYMNDVNDFFVTMSYIENK
jgi:hypothetical protein